MTPILTVMILNVAVIPIGFFCYLVHRQGPLSSLEDSMYSAK